MNSDEFLFVYGTLRKAAAAPMHDILARHCDYHADGVIRGRLFEVNGYPGLIESANPLDIVHGELYRIANREAVLPALDSYEECAPENPQPHEYIRKQLPIVLNSGEAIEAWVYVYNHDITNLEPISGGDYLQFLRAGS